MRNPLYILPAAERINSLDPSSGPKNHGKGRRCPENGCITLLCQANPGPKCFLHDELDRIREARLSMLGDRIKRLPLHQRDLGEFLARAA